MSLVAWIDHVGRFPVKKNPVHYTTPAVRLDVPRTGVLHTTEGGWDGSEGVFKRHFSPHFMLGWHAGTNRAEIEQLVPIGHMGMATRAHDNMAIVQVEMVGNAEEKPWLPGETPKNPHAETLDVLAELMLVCRNLWGIPLSHPWEDGNYGRASHNPHRSDGHFGHVAGWYGHGDMPDPDVHWDPGNLKWSQVFAHAADIEKARALVS